MKNKKINIFEILSTNKVVPEVESISKQKEMIKPDDDYDFHSYRILLLIYICGIIKKDISLNKIIYGRQKFAFLDFLVRYPYYLKKVLQLPKNKKYLKEISFKKYEGSFSFSPMIKYVRGPWDMRYNNILSYMVSKGLIEIKYTNPTKSSAKMLCIILSDLGNEIAEEISKSDTEWVNRMSVISSVFKPNSTNNNIEKFINKEFPELLLGGKINEN